MTHAGVAMALAVVLAGCTTGETVPTFEQADDRTRDLVVVAMQASGLPDRAFRGRASSGGMTSCVEGWHTGDPVSISYAVVADGIKDAEEAGVAIAEAWRHAGVTPSREEPADNQTFAFTGTVDGYNVTVTTLPERVAVSAGSPCVDPGNRRLTSGSGVLPAT